MLHSDFACRVAGLPLSTMSTLRAERSAALISELRALDRLIEHDKVVMSRILHEAVARTADRAQRASLLALRRGLYNLRPPSADCITVAKACLPSFAQELLEQVVANLVTRSTSIQTIRRTYDSELQNARRELRSAIAHEDFRCGVVLSSDVLFTSLDRYERTAPDAMSAREERIERGLLRYLSRMATKATPFGSFCIVVPGRVLSSRASPVQSTRPAIHGDITKRTHIRLNKALLPVIWLRLSRTRTVRDATRVAVNATAVLEGSALSFLTPAVEREMFRRLTLTDSLAAVLDVVRSTAPTLGGLIDALADDVRFDSSIDEARSFADRLVNVGLLRLQPELSDQDPDWDVALAELLAGVDDERAQRIVRLLQELRSDVTAFAAVGSRERPDILRHMRDACASAMTDLGADGAMEGRQPLYEDASAGCVAAVPEMTDAVSALEQLMRLLCRVAWPKSDQASMRHFFDQYYGDVERVSLLRFYEDYSREHLKEHVAHYQRALAGRPLPDDHKYDSGNPFGIPVVDARRKVWFKLNSIIREKLSQYPAAEELVLTRSDVEGAVADVPAHEHGPTSLSVFCHPLPPTSAGAAWQIVAPNAKAFIGFGKYFSRFLHMFPPAIRDHLEDVSASMTDDRIAEICGDSDFNGNLHPPLLPWEIDYPTLLRPGESARRMSCMDLDVRRSAADPHAVELRHEPSGDRVWPVDLGFLSMQLRPALYQLLCRFQPPTAVSLGLNVTVSVGEDPVHGINDGGESRPDSAVPHSQIEYSPRVCYEGLVVIARKTWFVPHDLIPAAQPGEHPADFFVRVQRWRAALRIPARVFVRVEAKRSAPAAQKQEEAVEDHPATPPQAPGRKPEAARRDNRKPQFIDFESPLLLKLFERLGRGLPSFRLVIEESLPDREHAFAHSTGDYASECLMQLDISAKEEAGRLPAAEL